MKRNSKFKTLFGLPRVARGERSRIKSRGFTLLEVLIYLAIFTIVSLAFSRIVMSLIAINSSQDARNEVLQQSSYSLETIQRLISEATTVVVRNKWGTGSDPNVYYYQEYPPVNPTGQNTCASNLTGGGNADESDCQAYTLTEERTTTTGNKLAANGGALGGIIESHLYLKMGEEAGDNTNDPNSPIHIYLESASGRVALEQGKGTGLKTLYLTDDKVKLTKLIFTKIIKVRKDINPAANLVTVSGTNTDVMLNGYKCIRVGSNHVCDTLYGNILQSDNAAQGRLAGELDKSKIPYVDGPEVINIDLAMNYNSTSPYKQFTKNFSLGVSKAKAAVFDTTLTPSTSSAKIGTSTNRWDVYGNTVDTTNLTVGSGSTLGYIYKGTFSYTIPVGGIAANDISAIVAGHGITVPAAGGFTPSNSIVIVTQNDGVFSHAIDPMFNLRVNSAGTNLIGWATNPSKTNGLIAGQIYNFNYMIMR